MFKKLQWLSVKNILENLQELFLRFPVVAMVTLVGTGSAYWLIERQRLFHNDATEHILTKVLLMAVFGVPLLTGLALVYEKFQWKKHFYWMLQGFGVVLLVLYYFVLPENPNDMGLVSSTRLLIFNVVAYLLALSVPFYEPKRSLKFWRFVEVAFARLVVAAFFSLTLWAGISASLAAIDYLFQANIEGETYFKAWILIVGIFGSWFFLAGFPKLHESLPGQVEHSRVLKVFLQYICVPLLCIFFVILYVYLGKIVVLWDWPKGGVADWILGFSSAGFLVYILSYPLLEKSEHSWMSKFFRVFFALVLPMVAVLFMAIGIRVNEYGLTESRYLVALGGVWLLVLSLYYLFSKQKELKLLPYLAAGFLFFASVGPWSMYSVSVWSQYNRLENLLSQYHLLENGKAVKISDENTIPQNDRASIHSKIQFIAEHEKSGKVYDWFSQMNTTTQSQEYSYGFASGAMEGMGITNYYESYPISEENQDYIYLNISSTNIFNVQGFDTMIRQVGIYPKQNNNTPMKYLVASTTYAFQLEGNTVKVLENDTETFSIDLTDSIVEWKEKYGTSPMHQQKAPQQGEMKIEKENATEKIRLLFDSLSLHKDSGVWKIENGDMSVFIDYK